MALSPNRRSFLHLSAGAAALGLSDLAWTSTLRPVSAAEASIDPKLVRLRPEIEPLVRLIEETPRERLLEEIGSRIKKGLSYQELLTGLFLAGVRNVQPRPNVGFKFHAVLVIHSAHLASLASADQERWLPLFWSLDRFKSGQADTIKQSGWRMAPVAETKVPPARQARKRFIEAMDNWDEEAADVATAAMARSMSSNELFELYAKYGSRDFRDIGHKAIYVANAFRTLHVIGWHHAEPILRSLTYALLQHEAGNPATRDAAADRPGRRAPELVKQMRENWLEGDSRPEAVTELLAMMREVDDKSATDSVLKSINQGVSPQSIWDGLFLTGGELLMRQPGIVALHSLTTLNALHYMYKTAATPEVRQTVLFQAAAFLPMFREAMKGRGEVGKVQIDTFKAADKASDVAEVFSTLTKSRPQASEQALAYLQANPLGASELITAGRKWIFLKGNDAHDYKFSSAIMEDVQSISPEHRNRFLAASLNWLKGSGTPDTPIVARIRNALA